MRIESASGILAAGRGPGLTHVKSAVFSGCDDSSTLRQRIKGRDLVRKAFAVLAAVMIAACAVAPERPDSIQLPAIGRFSAEKPGEALPSGWRVWTLSGLKRPTEYRLVDHEGRTVVLARSRAGASGLVFPIALDLREYPYLHWHWKVPALIEGADNSQRHTEDSPVRIVITFDGDRTTLPLEERLFADNFRLFTRQEFPYAILMYIWENRAPVGRVIDNLHTSRIKMIVADTGAENLGKWRAETRNVYDDFRRAFGEEPPPIRSIGIMTDSDNTGADAEGYYGDITFQRAGVPAR
jgi:hypothetical protein